MKVFISSILFLLSMNLWASKPCDQMWQQAMEIAKSKSKQIKRSDFSELSLKETYDKLALESESIKYAILHEPKLMREVLNNELLKDSLPLFSKIDEIIETSINEEKALVDGLALIKKQMDDLLIKKGKSIEELKAFDSKAALKELEVNKELPQENLEKIQAILEKTPEVQEERVKLLLSQVNDLQKSLTRKLEDTAQFGNESLIKEFLDILKTLKMAQKNAGTSESFKTKITSFIEEYNHFLKQNGVDEISPKIGDKIDLDIHEGAFPLPLDLAKQYFPQIENLEAGMIIEIQSAGYSYHGRTLIPAQVGVVQ